MADTQQAPELLLRRFEDLRAPFEEAIKPVEQHRIGAEAEKFGGWLAAATGLPVAFQDERYTSAEAAGKLAGTGLSRGRKKRVSDAIAAQILLTDWMDRSRSSAP